MTSRLRVPKLGTLRDHLEARINPPAIPLEVVADVFQGTGLGPPKSVRNVAHGWRTRVVMVDVGESRFVLRRYPDRWSDSAVEHEHSLLQELARLDFPAPRLVELGHGSYLRTIDGARYAAQYYETGVTLSGFHLGRAKICRLQRDIGRLLPEFHRALAGFVPAGRHHLGVDATTGRQRRDLNWHLKAIDSLTSGEGVAASTLAFVDDIASLRRRLVELDQAIEAADLPLAMIHGDYGLHNIIFRPSGEAVIHDFELSRTDLRLLDVVTSLSRLRPEFRFYFLAGVQEADGLDAMEKDMLESVWEWYRIRGAVQSAEAYARLGGEHRRAAVVKRMAEAAELRSGREMVPS